MSTTRRLLSGALTAALMVGISATGPLVGSTVTGLSLTPSAQALDPALVQNVGGDEAVVPRGNPVVISEGHIDIGPFIDDGEFTLLFRDDSVTPPVWRHLEDAVFVLDDNARQTIPEGADYGFTGAHPGDEVWAIPQNQEAGVPWLGWNTQSPTITHALSRGVNFSFGPHRGPGVASLFLQSGGFGGPQVLYSSADSNTQGMWVEMNTHTHANWVFTKPGRHVIDVQIDSQRTDGSEVSATRQLVFQVGDGAAEAAASAAGAGAEADADGAADEHNQDHPEAHRDAKNDRDNKDKKRASKAPSTSARPSASASARPSDKASDGSTDEVDSQKVADSSQDNGGGLGAGMIALIIGLFAVAIGLVVATVMIRRRRMRDAVMTQSQENADE